MPTRYLKPGICDSEAVDRCSPLAECLFYRLLVNVDDFGRIDARPAVIRSKCFPLKDTICNKDVEKLLLELQTNSLVLLYQSNGCAFLQMNKWDNVPRSKESKCPAPPDICIQVHTDVNKPHTNLPVTVTGTGTETVNNKPETETGTETKDLSPPSASTKKGTALPADWKLPKAWGEWALSEKPELKVDDIRRMADTFKDHWLANANRATGKKADWLATWRNWVRNSKAVAGVQFQTADQRRIASTDKSIAEWLGEGNGNVIEGECHAG